MRRDVETIDAHNPIATEYVKVVALGRGNDDMYLGRLRRVRIVCALFEPALTRPKAEGAFFSKDDLSLARVPSSEKGPSERRWGSEYCRAGRKNSSQSKDVKTDLGASESRATSTCP